MTNEEFSDELLKLDNQLCFALYVCSKEIVKLYKPLLDQLGLTYTQYITLLALWEEDDISVKCLGEKLFLDSGTLTPIIKKLEAKGILERKVNKEDERSIRIILTKQGEQLKNEILHVPGQVYCNTKLRPEEALNLKNSLQLLINNIKEDNVKETFHNPD